MSVSAHRSSSWYQSALRRASRETSIAEHDPDPAETDIGDQQLEAVATLRARARATQVAVDHDHLAGIPAERDRALSQLVLAFQALGVALDLRERALAHIHDRAPTPVRIGDLARDHSSRAAATSRASSRASRTVTCAVGVHRQRLPHRRRRPPASAPITSASCPDTPTSVFTAGSAAAPDAPPTRQSARRTAAARRRRRPPRTTARPHPPGRSVQRAGTVPALPSTSRQTSAVSPVLGPPPENLELDVAEVPRRGHQPHPLRQRIDNMSSSTPTRPAPARATWRSPSASAPAWPATASRSRPPPNGSHCSPTPSATARLDDELRRLERIPLLVVDEVGYIPFDPQAANLMFMLVSAPLRARVLDRHQQQAVQRLGEIFGDEVTAVAMIDRLVHHAEILSLKGDSYRLRDKDLGAPRGAQPTEIA